jgi:hypothetical protein
MCVDYNPETGTCGIVDDRVEHNEVITDKTKEWMAGFAAGFAAGIEAGSSADSSRATSSRPVSPEPAKTKRRY